MPEKELARLNFETPLGPIEIVGSDRGIYEVNFKSAPGESTSSPPDCLEECRKQLERYFSGRIRKFSLPVILEGTDFQQRVWEELRKIPYGST